MCQLQSAIPSVRNSISDRPPSLTLPETEQMTTKPPNIGQNPNPGTGSKDLIYSIGSTQIAICDDAIGRMERELTLKTSKRLIKNNRFLRERLDYIKKTREAFETIVASLKNTDRANGDIWFV